MRSAFLVATLAALAVACTKGTPYEPELCDNVIRVYPDSLAPMDTTVTVQLCPAAPEIPGGAP